MTPDTVLCRRTPAPLGAAYPFALVPVDERAAELLGKVPLGEVVAVQVKRDRSLPQHNLFFAILEHVAKASNFETPDRLLVALKIRLGKFDLCAMPSGKMVPVPHSISFAKMGEDEFQKFMDASLRVLCEEVIGGYDIDVLIAETQSAMGLRPEHDAGSAV